MRLHGTTGVAPFERLPHEGLSGLNGKPPYATSLVGPRPASRDCLVSYAGNRYSVPAAYAQQRVLLTVTEAEDVVITDARGVAVARPRMASGQGQRLVQPGHYRGLSTAPATPLHHEAAPPLDLATLLAAPVVETRALAVYDQLVGGTAVREGRSW